ncbi:hypothetical protein [Natronoglycomyces albus]|uniref:Uncharacterized protein n=1 Tax=Natronoglycomyces albus TaxID=2811108 RepID=A0A895XS46_9ACTN|nr:hypothetical protein [Natronoglycomyces albus]QSB06512.1 hypothetical protein JQS30_06305 [Natronoglycomyces albus]
MSGHIFRQAWIDGVTKHFPGEPKPGYVAPWEEMSEWEQTAAQTVYDQIEQFVNVSGGATARLSREQRGRFVATCWIAQIHKLIEKPKPSYVADWDQLPNWQRETDSDIFDAVEREVLS